MVARAGVYVRADIDDSSNEGLDQQITAVGAEDRSAELTFVDLHTRLGSPPAEGAIERLTATVQDRLHTISSADRLLFRAQGKVPSFAHDIVRERAGTISVKWPRDERYDTARGAVEVGLALLALG